MREELQTVDRETPVDPTIALIAYLSYGLRMSLITEPGWVQVTPEEGRLDRAWLRENSKFVELVTVHNPINVLIDLTGVAYVDGDFLDYVSELTEHCARRGGQLFIGNPPRILVNLLRSSTLDRGITYVGNRPELDPTWLSARTAAATSTLLAGDKRLEDTDDKSV